jgi:hypothetical protein
VRLFIDERLDGCHSVAVPLEMRYDVEHRRQGYMVRQVRLSLLVLVLAGTIINAWTVTDRLRALPPPFTASINAINDEIAAVNYTVADAERASLNSPASTRGIGDREMYAIKAKVFAQSADKLQRQKDRLTRRGLDRQANVFHTWEQAAKVEFALLAGAVCVWLLLPRANASQP